MSLVVSHYVGLCVSGVTACLESVVGLAGVSMSEGGCGAFSRANAIEWVGACLRSCMGSCANLRVMPADRSECVLSETVCVPR